MRPSTQPVTVGQPPPDKKGDHPSQPPATPSALHVISSRRTVNKITLTLQHLWHIKRATIYNTGQLDKEQAAYTQEFVASVQSEISVLIQGFLKK